MGVTAVYAFEPMAEWVPENDARSWHSRAEDEVSTWTAASGKGGFSGLRLGRVPLQLVDQAGAAVIVVPHATGG